MGLQLNLGCGRSPLAGWVNVDVAALPGIDVVADLDACKTTPLPFADGTVSRMQMLHVLEHIGDMLSLMQELHRIAEPGAKLLVRGPYGANDDAWEDPTHKQRLFVNSFTYFAQPTYWRADYGYRGDWETEKITLTMRRSENEGLPTQEVVRKVQQLRNVVVEMIVELVAVKPIRLTDRALMRATPITITLV